MTHQLKFVEDRVLALLFPMIEEYVFEQPRQLGVWIDTLAVVKLNDATRHNANNRRPGRSGDQDDGPRRSAMTTELRSVANRPCGLAP